VNKLIAIGKNKTLEKGVILGQTPSRKVADMTLVLGKYSYLRSGTVIYLGTKIGERLQTGHNAIIREENLIGDHFCLWSNSIVDYGCKIGDNVTIHCNCYIVQYTVMEDDVFLAPGVIVANDLHPGTPDAVECMKGPTLKKGAQIGCNVTLLPHVTIGKHSLIGAGSVVTKDVPAYSLAYGNPARVVKRVTEFRCRVKDHNPYKFLLKGGEAGGA